MASLFPSTPTSGDIVEVNGYTYVYDSTKGWIKTSNIKIVSSLPVTTSAIDVLYVLTTDNSINYYTTSWNKINTANQILIQNTQPTDTTKLWLDNTNLSIPRLKYYNGTNWVSGNVTINDSASLGDTSEVFSANHTLTLTNALKSDIGDITSLETTNKSSLTVAVNEVLDKINSSNTASNISYDNSTSGISATNIQACLDFLFNTSASNKASLAGVLGSPSTTNETFTQLISDITSQKVVLANTLTNKGISSLSSESINSLVTKVNQINMGGGNIDQVTLDVTAPYIYTYTFTNPINIKNLCQTLIYYTEGSIGVSKYNCGFDSTDSSNFNSSSNITFNGTASLNKKITTGNFTYAKDFGDGSVEWTSIPLDENSFNTIDYLKYVDSDTPSLTICGTNFPEIISNNSDIDLSNILKINTVTWTTNIGSSGTELMILSFDSGTTWKAYNGTSWEIVNTSNLTDVKAKGMSPLMVSSLTSTELESVRNNSTIMRIGYYIEDGNYNDITNIDYVQVTVDLMGTYSITPDSSYTTTLSSDGSKLTYVFSVSGKYTINIVDNT